MIARRSLLRGASALPFAKGVLRTSRNSTRPYALPAVAETAVPVAHPDAGLLDLIARHAEADAVWDRTEAEEDRLYEAAKAAHPPRPHALRWRPDELPGSWGSSLSDPDGDAGERWYGDRGVEWMRDRPFEVWSSPLGAVVPDARWETRRLEIVAAFDGWQAAKRKVDAESGLDAASEAVCEADDVLAEIEAEILATAPTTFDGLHRKAAWANRPGLNDVTAGLWARRVMADVLALAERGGAGA